MEVRTPSGDQSCSPLSCKMCRETWIFTTKSPLALLCLFLSSTKMKKLSNSPMIRNTDWFHPYMATISKTHCRWHGISEAVLVISTAQRFTVQILSSFLFLVFSLWVIANSTQTSHTCHWVVRKHPGLESLEARHVSMSLQKSALLQLQDMDTTTRYKCYFEFWLSSVNGDSEMK